MQQNLLLNLGIMTPKNIGLIIHELATKEINNYVSEECIEKFALKILFQTSSRRSNECR